MVPLRIYRAAPASRDPADKLPPKLIEMLELDAEPGDVDGARRAAKAAVKGFIAVNGGIARAVSTRTDGTLVAVVEEEEAARGR